MRALVFETDSSGHHLQYVRSIIDALREARVSDVVFGTQADVPESSEYRAHLQEIRETFTIDTACVVSGSSSSSIALSRFLALCQAIKRNRPDHVYVPYADGLMQLSGAARLLGFGWRREEVTVEGLLMRGRYAYSLQGVFERLKGLATRWSLGLAPFEVIHQLDPFAYAYLKNNGRSFSRRCRLIPEAVEPMQPVSLAAARARLGIAVQGRYLGCLGSLDARKGVDLLIRAFAGARLQPTDRLLLMGAIDQRIQRLLDGEFVDQVQSGRIVVVKGHVSQETFHLGFNAVNVLGVTYPRHIGSSGIVVRAAALGKPVFGSNFGWIGAVIADFGLGWACNVSDPTQLTRAIEHVMSCCSDYRQSDAAKQFVRFHTLENFKLHWTHRIRQRLGNSASPPLVSWDTNVSLPPSSRARD